MSVGSIHLDLPCTYLETVLKTSITLPYTMYHSFQARLYKELGM